MSRGLKRTLSSLVPLAVKTSVYSRLNNARLARLLRAKQRFRQAQNSYH
jgi:hypothetical protein